MSNFNSLGIKAVMPYLEMTRDTKVLEVMEHINKGPKYITEEAFEDVTADEFMNNLDDAIYAQWYDTQLECVEAWASNEGLIDSEEALSEQFDDMLDEMLEQPDSTLNIEDKPMMREFFNNWTDGLTADGMLHSTQYNTYCYCGKHNFDD